MKSREILVLSCEHAGNRVPDCYRFLFAGKLDLLKSHRGYDIGAAELAETLTGNLNAPLFRNDVTRLLVDTNRSTGHRALFSEFSRSLPAGEREKIMRDIYWPHRDAVLTGIRHIMESGRGVVHVSIHTFTPSLNGVVRSADIGLLYDPSRTAEKVFCMGWAKELKTHEPALRVRKNYPYRGRSDGFTTWLRSRFSAEWYRGIELEVNQEWADVRRGRDWKLLQYRIAAALKPMLGG